MTGNAAEETRIRAERYQQVVEDGLKERLGPEEFLERLKAAGASSRDAQDYVDQFSQRIAEVGSRVRPEGENLGPREQTPEGLNDDEQADFRRRRDERASGNDENQGPSHQDAVEAAAWKILEAKLRRAAPASSDDSQGELLTSELIKLFGGSTTRSGALGSIPSTVLEAAPHLRNLTAQAVKDPHLEATFKLRSAYVGKEVVDSIVDVLQLQSLVQPLPRSMWKTLLQDQYADFEKLFASMEPGYDQNDDPKDFGDGYALIKKDQVTAKKPLRTEADWIRVFSAWKTGVLLLFPHRQDELDGYERMVINIFRVSPHNPLGGIQFDSETRQRYAKSPFRMDDKDESHLSILSQLYRASSQVENNKHKRAVDAVGSSRQKRATTICNNWNLGFCEDPCPNRRKHGVCCECGGRHAAREASSCLAQVQARRGKGGRAGGSEGGGSGSGRS